MAYFHDQLRSIAAGTAHSPAFDGYEQLTQPQRPSRTRSFAVAREVFEGCADAARALGPFAALLTVSSFFSQYLPQFNPARHLLPSLVAAGLRQSPELHVHDSPQSHASPQQGVGNSGHGQEAETKREQRGFRVACRLMQRIPKLIAAGRIDGAIRSLDRLLRVLDAVTPETLQVLSPTVATCVEQMGAAMGAASLTSVDEQIFAHYRFLLLARIGQETDSIWAGVTCVGRPAATFALV